MCFFLVLPLWVQKGKEFCGFLDVCVFCSIGKRLDELSLVTLCTLYNLSMSMVAYTHTPIYMDAYELARTQTHVDMCGSTTFTATTGIAVNRIRIFGTSV